MLYLITLLTMQCITYLPATDTPYDFSRYNPIAVEVYEESALDDNLADKIFTTIYIVDDVTYQCNK